VTEACVVSGTGDCGDDWAEPIRTVAVLEVSSCRSEEPTCYHSWTGEITAEWCRMYRCLVIACTVCDCVSSYGS